MIRELSVVLMLAAPPKEGWFGTDKVKHFFMSAFVHSVTFSAARALGASRPAAQVIGAGTTGLVGIGREVHDQRQGRTFSVRDLTWDAAGAVSAAVLLRRTR
jgi:uncharacterized protein YfiM (DUF2279 family)